MARVTGPLMSIEASGTYAKTLTYSKWKGRPYVRERVIPLNPKSAKQTGVRVMLAFIANAWASLDASAKASWAAEATARAISAYNAFASDAMSRWQNFLGPTQESPAAGASTPVAVTTMTLTGGAGMISVAVTPAGDTDTWAIAIFREAAEITAPSWANCVAVLPVDGTNAVTFVDTPLTAGTYHYRCCVLNIDGVKGEVKADDSAVAT